MELTVETFIKSTENALKGWERGADQIKNGTFPYDNSMPKSCVDALYEHKVKICKETLNYLNTLDKTLVIQNEKGTTKEGLKYYEMINS